MYPNFIVIGATRSGTTSLHHYLGQHSEIFMCPVNEPNFFLFEGEIPNQDHPYLDHLRASSTGWVRDPRAYEQLFDGVVAQTAVGEVSPLYMQTCDAPRLIGRKLPEARLIAVLRQPVDRAYAQFMGRRREGMERRTRFEDAIRDEPREHTQPVIAGMHMLTPSRYHRFLRPFFDRLPRDRIWVGLFDDFARDPRDFLHQIFGFLGVDPGFEADTSTRHNATGVIRNPLLRWMWTRSRNLRLMMRPYLPAAIRDLAQPVFMRNLVRPQLNPSLRADLTARFHGEISDLEDLIGRDLGHWRR